MTDPINKNSMGSTIGQPEPADYRESVFNWSTPVRKPQRSSFKIGNPEKEYDDSRGYRSPLKFN